MAADVSSPLEGVTSEAKTPPIKLAICVAFHYVEARLEYLAALGARFSSLAREVVATVVTNTDSQEHHQRIAAVFRDQKVAFSTFTAKGLGHPFLLPWSHFEVMRERVKDESITHFMYLEDDLLCTQEHVNYLLEAREMLRPLGLIPGLFRVEQNPGDGEWYCTDQVERVDMGKCRRIALGIDSGLGFINLPRPYQAMYFLDRDLMLEHLGGPSSTPQLGGNWGVREKAAQGLTFAKVPEGFSSRIVVPYYEDQKRIAQCCLMHHMTNSYASDPASRIANIRVRDVFL
jgi:hypothetical protein